MEKIANLENKPDARDNLETIIKELVKLVSISQRWLTMREACLYAKMSKNTLMGCIADGNIKASKQRGKWIVDRSSIDAYYEDGETEALVNDLLAKRKIV